jgi:hypothetical protein
MAVLACVPADALVCPGQAEALRGLRPFLGVAGIHCGGRSSDEGRDAARPAVLRLRHKADATLEAHPDLKAVGAGKLAVHEQRPADAALVPASAAHREIHADRLMLQASAAVALCKQGADQFAA